MIKGLLLAGLLLAQAPVAHGQKIYLFAEFLMLRCLPAVATQTEIRTDGLAGVDVTDASGTELTIYRAKEPDVTLMARDVTACTVEGKDLEMGEMTDLESKAFGPTTPFLREPDDPLVPNSRRYRWARDGHDILALFSSSNLDASVVATIARVPHGDTE